MIKKMKSIEEDGRRKGAVARGSWQSERRCFISPSLFNLLMRSLAPAEGMEGEEEKGGEGEGWLANESWTSARMKEGEE